MKSIKLNLLFVIIFSLLIVSLGSCKSKNDISVNSELKIGVLLFAPHPVIDEIYDGFKTQLLAKSDTNNRNIVFDVLNADGNPAQASLAAGTIKAKKRDLVFVVGVPAAQALKATIDDVPVIFAGPPDPVAAGLVDSMKGDKSNFTGTSYFPPVEVILETYLASRQSDSAGVAMIRNPGEANSKAVADKFLEAASSRGVKITDYTVTNNIEIETALRSMKSSSTRGLFITTDNLVYSNLERITSFANEAGIAVFNCTELSVERGADFSLATDYYTIGSEAALIAADILFSEKSPSNIDVVAIKEGKMYVNSAKRETYSAHVPDGYVVEYVE